MSKEPIGLLLLQMGTNNCFGRIVAYEDGVYVVESRGPIKVTYHFQESDRNKFYYLEGEKPEPPVPLALSGRGVRHLKSRVYF